LREEQERIIEGGQRKEKREKKKEDVQLET
jgi:hypothetical protein